MSKVITTYIDTVLSPRLREYGVSLDFQKDIYDVITEQMTSALYHWKEMRNVSYTLTAEEAQFYRPEAPIDVKVFVVLTARNSPIETLQSDNYKQAGLKQKISESQLKTITSEAITYFKDVSLDTCGENISLLEDEDLYGYLKEVYCIAWRTLEQISNSETQSCTFSSYGYKENVASTILKPYREKGDSVSKELQVIVDGYDITIDDTLYLRLKE